MQSNKNKDYFFLLIQLATILVFLGRAWQHWFWDAPFRALLWDENWMRGILESLTTFSWQEYITSNAVDDMIQRVIQGFGCIYFLLALVAWRIKKIGKGLGRTLWLGSFLLALLAALYCKEKFFSLGQFLEYTIQFSSPIFLYLLRFQPEKRTQLFLGLKIAIALTFTCHGLYAINYYPRPGNFVQMTIDILGVSESIAFSFLNLAGILDFAMAILIFFPVRIAKWALLYATFWGLATAVARVWANFYWDFPMASLHQWLHEMVMRLSHGLIPLALWWELVWAKRKRS